MIEQKKKFTKNPYQPKPEPKPGPSIFPPAWNDFIDEVIPSLVKKTYSPRDRWKDKPFSKEDAKFFFKGIEELSELFTDERPKGMPSYFQHSKFRSSYLLYFLPFQAAKFLTLFKLHPEAIRAALKHGSEKGTLRIMDMGAGPGTASLAFVLLLLSSEYRNLPLPPIIEFHWFDTNLTIMKDGMSILDLLLAQYPELQEKVRINTYEQPWWKAPFEIQEDASLVFMGHVLNENPAVLRQQVGLPFWKKLFQKAQGGGVLMVEPAAKQSSQLLSQLRDEFIESNLVKNSPTQIWGPCLHAGKCPLAQGRDWCHFSVPTQIPGQWFKTFSLGLGSERQWVKYSYLWFASTAFPSPEPKEDLRRVISDPLQTANNQKTILLCEPTTPRRWPMPPHQNLYRGDLIHFTQKPSPIQPKVLIDPSNNKDSKKSQNRFSKNRFRK